MKYLGPNATISAQTAPRLQLLTSALLGLVLEKHHKAHLAIGYRAPLFLAASSLATLHPYP